VRRLSRQASVDAGRKCSGQVATAGVAGAKHSEIIVLISVAQISASPPGLVAARDGASGPACLEHALGSSASEASLSNTASSRSDLYQPLKKLGIASCIGHLLRLHFLLQSAERGVRRSGSGATARADHATVSISRSYVHLSMSQEDPQAVAAGQNVLDSRRGEKRTTLARAATRAEKRRATTGGACGRRLSRLE